MPDLNILAKFGYDGQIWSILSSTDMEVTGKKVTSKDLIPKWKLYEVQF